MVDPEGFEPSASEDSRDVRRSTTLSYGPIYQPRGTKGVLGLETKMFFLLVITAAFASPQTIKLKYPVA